MTLALPLRVDCNDNKPSTRRRAAASVGGLLLTLFNPGASVAAPTGVQSLAEVARRAEEAVRELLPSPAAEAVSDGATRHRIAARAPDARLRLPACPTPLVAVLPAVSGGLRARTLVQVSCQASTARWSVLVPVGLETDAELLIAARPMSRGQTPGTADVRSARRSLPGISTLYISNLNEIRAQHLIRAVATGQALTRDLLAAAPVVRRGEAVTLVANLSGLEIRVPGRALADARPGDRVRVQNVNSLKIIEGRADEAGVVEVDR